MHVVRLRSLVLVLTAVLAVACGQGTPLSSPTAPTGMPASAALTIDGDADAWATASTADEFAGLGNGNGNGKGKDKDKHDNEAEDDDDDDDDGEDHHGEDHHGSRRELSGFVTAVGTDSITVRGITVKIVAGTIIRHGHRTLTIADVEVGDHAQARGTMSADGTTLTASEIKVEDTDNDNDDDEDDAKVEGALSALSGTCPAVTFTVGTTNVTTNAATKFDDVTCAALANGMAVEVKGARQTDGSILATNVERDLDEVEGTVSALAGTCPALTFNVGTTKVTTSSTTTFEDGTCATVANGKTVEVKGTKQTDGSIAAVSVEFD